MGRRGDWDGGIAPIGTLTSIGNPISCCQKGGADLTRVVVNIPFNVSLNPNQETQLVTKGIVNTLNASVDLSDPFGCKTGLKSGVRPEVPIRHIQLKEESNIDPSTTNPGGTRKALTTVLMGVKLCWEDMVEDQKVKGGDWGGLSGTRREG